MLTKTPTMNKMVKIPKWHNFGWTAPQLCQRWRHGYVMWEIKPCHFVCLFVLWFSVFCGYTYQMDILLFVIKMSLCTERYLQYKTPYQKLLFVVPITNVVIIRKRLSFPSFIRYSESGKYFQVFPLPNQSFYIGNISDLRV